MARLFITLYISVVASVIALVMAIDYFAANFAYDIDTEDSLNTVRGYVHVLQTLEQHSSESVTLATMHRAADINGLILSTTPPDDVAQNSQLTKLSAGEVYYDAQLFDDDLTYFKLTPTGPVYHIQPNTDSPLWQKQASLELFTFYSLLGITALVLGWFLWLLHRKLKKAEAAALALAAGRLETRLSNKPKDRVGQLNASFNHMAEQIESLIGSHKRLTHSVAHELRTPIFRIRLQLELLAAKLEEANLSTTTEGFITGIEEDLASLDRLLDEMLTYARLERKDLALNLVPVRLDQWLGEKLNHLSLCSRFEVTFSHPADGTIKPLPTLAVDEQLLLRALANLVRNSDRHAHSIIEISLSQHLNTLRIHVDDDGPGFSKDDQHRLLNAFEQSGDTAQGYGLGLAIVKEIMVRHRGSILLGRGSLGGARVTLSFPTDDRRPSQPSDQLSNQTVTSP